jgi:hypothetical protein
MLRIALTPTIEPVAREDGTIRLISAEPFAGSTATGKAKDIHHRILSGPAAEAFTAFLDGASSADLLAAMTVGYVDLDVTDASRKRGAPRQSAPTLAERVAALAAAEATAEAKSAKSATK